MRQDIINGEHVNQLAYKPPNEGVLVQFHWPLIKDISFYWYKSMDDIPTWTKSYAVAYWRIKSLKNNTE